MFKIQLTPRPVQLEVLQIGVENPSLQSKETKAFTKTRKYTQVTQYRLDRVTRMKNHRKTYQKLPKSSKTQGKPKEISVSS